MTHFSTNLTGYRSWDLTDPGAALPPGAAGATGVDFSSFTPDDLVLWARDQLQGIDQQMSQLVAEIRTNSLRSSLFAQVTAFVNQFQANHPTSDTSATLETEGNDANAQFTFQMPDGSSQQMTLQQALAECGINVSGTINGTYNGSNVANLVNTLQGFANTISDNSEELSLKLQNLTSKRAQITQTASQLIQSLNDTASKVVGNIH